MSRIIDNLKDNLISYIAVAILTGFIGAFTGYNNKETELVYFCPTYPVAGEKVAKELSNIPKDGYENFWEWIGRIDKLRQELELCK